jgi:DNA invertase Pin-like site-specific DNA recombinase
MFVFNTDRLSRNDSVWYLIKIKLIANGVTLYTCTGIYALTDPMNKLLLGILSEISSYDNSLRAERSRLGKLNRVRQGQWMGGPPPFGYKIENKRLVENSDESRWIRFIYESYVSKKTIRWIKAQLINNDVKTRRNKNPWTLGSIQAILRNTHYAGYYHYKDNKSGELIRASCDSLISYTLFREVNEEKQKRNSRSRVMGSHTRITYLLKNYLICGHCGSIYSARSYQKTERSVYYCPRIERNFQNEHTNKFKTCTNRRYLKIKETDDLVWNVVIKAISDTESIKMSLNLDSHGEFSNTSSLDPETIRSKIVQLEADIKECTNSIIELEANKIINKRTRKETEQILLKVETARIELEAERESLINDLELCRNKESFLSYIASLKEELCENSELSVEYKRSILSNIIENIHVRTLDKQLHELTVNFHLAYATDSNYEKVLENSSLITSSKWARLGDTHGMGDSPGTGHYATSGYYRESKFSLWNSDACTPCDSISGADAGGSVAGLRRHGLGQGRVRPRRECLQFPGFQREAGRVARGVGGGHEAVSALPGGRPQG